jgi:hypothetical protein
MITVTVLAMVMAVAAVLLGGIAWAGRSRVHARNAGTDADGGAGWMAAVFTGDSGDSGGADCSAGDAGCDGGGGGGE